MILPILANVEWPSAIVASFLIVCPTVFFTAAVIRHKMQEVEKLAGYFASTFGILLGVFITYFFTSQQAQRQEAQIKTIESAFQTSEKQKLAAGQQALQLATRIKGDSDWIDPQQAAETLQSIATKLTPVYGPMMKESPRPSAHATAPSTFHDLFKRNTPQPSPSASP
jgi:hypothetical protein